MARRYVVNTWNNAAVVKKPKPIEPLRYRINPLDKEYDKLDALQAELDRTADTLEPEHYHDMYASLQARRERLEERRQRALGNGPDRRRPVAQGYTAPVRAHARHARRPNVSPLAYKVLFICLAVILFKIAA